MSVHSAWKQALQRPQTSWTPADCNNSIRVIIKIEISNHKPQLDGKTEPRVAFLLLLPAQLGYTTSERNLGSEILCIHNIGKVRKGEMLVLSFHFKIHQINTSISMRHSMHV